MLHYQKALFLLVVVQITTSCFDFTIVEDIAECHNKKPCAGGQICNEYFKCVSLCNTNVQCDAGHSCDNQTCVVDPRFCAGDDDCDKVEFCKNNTCVEKSPQGASCVHNIECASGSCSDGYCCSAACDDLCFSCNSDYTEADNGVCSPLSDGEDDAEDCAESLACNGQGACHSSESGSSCSEDYECTTDNCKRGFCRGSLCGNGTVDPGEECDDENDEDTDSCTNQCRAASCGDGYVQQEKEECDSGDANSDELADTCRTDCRSPRCGDGVTDSGELCDDSAENSDRYQLERFCDTTCSAYSPYCGDDHKTDSEECDTGYRNSDTEPNSCRTTCKKSSCGDGVIDADEDCDDGVRNSNNGGSCNESCNFPVCGNGIKDGNDECDNGEFNTNDPLSSFSTTPPPCRKYCTLAGCGDSIHDTTEDCDDGDAADSKNGCSVLCKNNSVCGNDTVESLFETCDDGNALTETQCPYATRTCKLCNNDCSQALSLTGPYCGDGKKTDQEDCEDGNATDDNNGCSENCEQNNDCGDGRREDMFEVCDDGSDTSAVRFNGKGQSSCVDDCTAVQSCGDDITNGTEQCDDGGDNGKGDTYCVDDCTAIQDCGDGILNGTEECDEGEENGELSAYCTVGCISLVHIGDVIINSHSDLDAISGKQKIDGNMEITQLSVAQITFPDIREVTGDVSIFRTNDLTRINFSSLIRIHGNLTILPGYTIKNGFPSAVHSNDHLTHALFPRLGAIGDFLYIKDNPVLETVSFVLDINKDFVSRVTVIGNPNYCPRALKELFRNNANGNFHNNRSETNEDGCSPPGVTP